MGLDRDRILRLMKQLRSISGVSHVGYAAIDEVFELYVTIRKLSFADCFHSVLARSSPSATIVTFDLECDRVPGLIGVEPPELPSVQ
jgi:predicted nucleic acid-binding protein